ncbi:hypothetical protein Aperf_G00000054216 [Anoplocephala perfoliata]
MALDITFAGAASKEAISLLEQLLDGTVHFMRQGALIGMAVILKQQDAISCPKSAEFCERCLRITSWDMLTRKREGEKQKFETAILTITAQNRKKELEKKNGGVKTKKNSHMSVEKEQVSQCFRIRLVYCGHCSAFSCYQRTVDSIQLNHFVHGGVFDFYDCRPDEKIQLYDSVLTGSAGEDS